MTGALDVVRAAEDAERATLWSDAARLYEEALSLLAGAPQPGADEAALLTALGRCYWNTSDVRASWRTLRRAMALCEQRGDAVGLARATVEILRIWGPPEKQREMAERALEALGSGDPRLRAHLLLRLERRDEAFALADAHGFGEVQAARDERAGWEAMRAGSLDEGVAALRTAHAAFAANGALHPAAGTLRGAGFSVLAAGRLDQGERLADEATRYAAGVHLKFQEDLARLDLAGVAFARCDFARCDELIRPSLGGTDFRADAYRMWMVEQGGDIAGALALLIEPARAGGAPTAISQIHAANASVLHHAGRAEAATQELAAWAEVARQHGSFAEEAPAVADCLVDLADDALAGEVLAAYTAGPAEEYATLQGRCTGYVRGALALRLGRIDEAAERFADARALAERERCPVDAARCLEGLARVAAARWQTDEMDALLRQARALYRTCGAQLYIDRMAASA